jgi:hypothetical protein
MANHVLTCPVCHSSLLIAHNTSLGGEVMDNLVLLDSAVETPAAAKARVVWEAALAAQEAPQTALYAAQGALAADAEAIPVDDAKIAADAAALEKAKADLAVATKATLEADAAYAAARALPPPLEVGDLDATGNWSWGGDEWIEVAKIPPPLPPEAVVETPAFEAAEDRVEKAQAGVTAADAEVAAANAVTPPDSARVAAAATAKASADAELAAALNAQSTTTNPTPVTFTSPLPTTAVNING